MHAGTQTLIQALQAMPWADMPDDEDGPPQGDTPPDTSSDDEDDRRRESFHYIILVTRPSHELRQSVT